jgi:osmoprotectant transport system permease protein
VSRAIRLREFRGPAIATVVYLALAAMPGLWIAVLHRLYPNEPRLLYPDATMLQMIGQHLLLVGLSSVLSVAVGVSLGVFVTRPAGRDFFDVVTDLSNLGQTFPPVAVFTLAVPLLGFGVEPTVLALAIYGVLPVLHNTISGLQSLPETIIESARATGMRPRGVLWRVELPIASPIILAGIRISVVVNVATATIGAIANAGGLGTPIISGLVNLDPAITLQGALLAAGLALILDAFLGILEHAAARRVGSARY